MTVEVNNASGKIPIGQVIDNLYDGPHATPTPSAEGPVFLGIKNITDDGRLDLSEVRHISEEEFPKWTRRVLPKPGDIVFTYEATLNRYAIIPEGFRGCLGRRLALIRPNPSKVDTQFLFYYFFGEDWRTTISQNTLSGSTVDRIALTTFQDFEIDLPPLSTQRKIASVLSAYDDLIENNTRRIQILEEMAQAIYREWFVNFRFPGYEKVGMVESPLGEIPEEWEMRQVKDLLKRLKAGNTYKDADVGETGEVIVIDQSRSSLLGFHDNFPDHVATPQQPVVIFGDHTCKMQLMVEPFSVGPNVVPFVSPDKMSLLFLYFLVENLVETREYKRHWTELTNKVVVVPPKKLAREFSTQSMPLIEYINLLTKRNSNIRRTRDLLLPKLISGEIDVSSTTNLLEAEIF